jgi:Zn-dependent protease
LHVRLHSFFLLFAAFTLLLGWTASLQPEMEDALLIAAASLGVLFVSVLVHELAHLGVARRLGGGSDEIVLGPLGGMAPLRSPPDAQADCLVHLAGPIVNLAISLCAGLLIVIVVDQSLIPLLHPLAPGGLTEGDASWIRGAKLVFWINWGLFLVNMLPAFPFDGGRALRAALARVWPDASPRRPAAIVATVAKFAAFALLVASFILLLRPANDVTPVPAWFALLLLAIFLYFSAKQEEDRHDERESEEDVFGYDFSQGYTSLERSTEPRQESTGMVQQWLEQRRQNCETRRRQQEADEEGRVDEILTRLHEQGMKALSDEDRALLQRVSERYRERK